MKRTAMVVMILMSAACMAASDKLPREGSYIIVHTLDEDTGKQLQNFTLIVSFEYPGAYSKDNYAYQQRYYAGETRIGFSMPPAEYKPVAKISVTADGYSKSETKEMTGEFYWKNLGKDHLQEYTFKIKRQNPGCSLLPALLGIMAALSACIAKVSGA